MINYKMVGTDSSDVWYAQIRGPGVEYGPKDRRDRFNRLGQPWHGSKISSLRVSRLVFYKSENVNENERVRFILDPTLILHIPMLVTTQNVKKEEPFLKNQCPSFSLLEQNVMTLT